MHLLSGAGGLLTSQACLCKCRQSAEPLCMTEQLRSCCLMQVVTTLEGSDSGAILSSTDSPAHVCCSSRLAAGSACGEPGLLPAWQNPPSAKDHFCALLHIRLSGCVSASSTALLSQSRVLLQMGQPGLLVGSACTWACAPQHLSISLH